MKKKQSVSVCFCVPVSVFTKLLILYFSFSEKNLQVCYKIFIRAVFVQFIRVEQYKNGSLFGIALSQQKLGYTYHILTLLICWNKYTYFLVCTILLFMPASLSSHFVNLSEQCRDWLIYSQIELICNNKFLSLLVRSCNLSCTHCTHHG